MIKSLSYIDGYQIGGDVVAESLLYGIDAFGYFVENVHMACVGDDGLILELEILNRFAEAFCYQMDILVTLGRDEDGF
jgi:hypothetical protein